MRYLSNIVFAVLITGCSVVTVNRIPTPEQILKSDAKAQIDKAYAAAKVLSSIVKHVGLSEAGSKKLAELDDVRFFYISKAEVLIAEGKFKDAELYITESNIVLYRMVKIVQDDNPTEKDEKSRSEKDVHNPETLL